MGSECKRLGEDECKSPFDFLEGNIIWIVVIAVLVFFPGIFGGIFGGHEDEESCGAFDGLFDGNIIWIILLIIIVGPLLGFGEKKD